MKENYIIISNRKYHKDWIELHNPENIESCLWAEEPDVIFFPFWSWRVPGKILDNYVCYGFHIGELPDERGGSPIQNLIRLGRKRSTLNLLRMTNKLDGGEVLMTKLVSLEGTLDEILIRTSSLIMEMINDFPADCRQQACRQH